MTNKIPFYKQKLSNFIRWNNQTKSYCTMITRQSLLLWTDWFGLKLYLFVLCCLARIVSTLEKMLTEWTSESGCVRALLVGSQAAGKSTFAHSAHTHFTTQHHHHHKSSTKVNFLTVANTISWSINNTTVDHAEAISFNHFKWE